MDSKKWNNLIGARRSKQFTFFVFRSIAVCYKKITNKKTSRHRNNFIQPIDWLEDGVVPPQYGEDYASRWHPVMSPSGLLAQFYTRHDTSPHPRKKSLGSGSSWSRQDPDRFRPVLKRPGSGREPDVSRISTRDSNLCTNVLLHSPHGIDVGRRVASQDVGQRIWLVSVLHNTVQGIM